jgi:gas vesicle protein
MKRLLIGGAVGTIIAAVLTYVLGWTRKGKALRGRATGLWSRGTPLEEMTKEELYRLAQKADISGRSEMSKEELIQALQKQ